MTVVALTPDSTVANTGSVTGAASAHAALADSSDATYVELDLGEGFAVTVSDLTLPALAVLKSAAHMARVASVTASVGLQLLTNHDGAGDGGIATVTWNTPTTGNYPVSNAITDAGMDSASLSYSAIDGLGPARVYKSWVDVTYVTQPVVVPASPAGTVTTTNLPTVTWTDTLDSDGGAQTKFEVRVFTDAQYGAGGFDPASSPSTMESGVKTGTSTSWSVTDHLPDDTYRAYVRVAQTVNGSAHWSDWDYTEFEIDVALPAVPLLYLTAENEEGRVRIDVDDQSGDATTDALEVQRSIDNLTWEPVRLTTDTAGVLAGSYATAWDMEGGNGQTVYYRARALHDYSGEYAASDWASDDTAWTERKTWWLKSPQHPSLNTKVRVHSLPAYERPARQGRFQALSGRRAIVVSDTRGADQGSIVFRVDTDALATAIDDIIDYGGILLLQGSWQDNGWTDRYVVLGDLNRSRLVDKGFVEGTLDEFSWIEVEPPAGLIDEWPDEAS